MHGEGVYSFSSGAEYNGAFAKNKFEGFGTYRWKDGCTYTGEWKDNKMHGKSTFYGLRMMS